MFFKNKTRFKPKKEKEFEFDMFMASQNHTDDQTQLKIGEPRQSFNFVSQDGTLKSGYGFEDLSMPTSTEDLENEQQVTIRGDHVQTIWKLKWYNKNSDINCYYLFYYNNENYMCFDDMFDVRYEPLIWQTEYTQLPYITYYRQNKQDAILLSGKDGNLMVLSGSGQVTHKEAPAIVSCCTHYGKLFAITATARGTLVYADKPEVDSWSDELSKDLDFSDERGDMNKIISFNDYLYIFRDFGITQVSEYGKDNALAVSHMYKADGYIHPNTIVQSGDEVYFLEGCCLKSFNGSSVKTIQLSCLELLADCDNRYAFAQCFEGKYFLACKGDFKDGQKIGCENADKFCNNLLIVYDFASEHVDILRGVDINKLLAFTTNYKSKLLACFYNENKAKIGQLTSDGNIFGEKLASGWSSGQTDFDLPGKRKKIKSFLIKTKGDCQIVFASDEENKTYDVKGSDRVQKISADVAGNMFEVKIISKSTGQDYISKFVVTVSK